MGWFLTALAAAEASRELVSCAGDKLGSLDLCSFKCQRSRSGKSWVEELSRTLLLTTVVFAFSSPDPDLVSMDGTGVSLVVRSDMFEACNQRIPIAVERDFFCGR